MRNELSVLQELIKLIFSIGLRNLQRSFIMGITVDRITHFYRKYTISFCFTFRPIFKGKIIYD